MSFLLSLLFIMPVHSTNQLTLTYEGKVIDHVQREELMIPFHPLFMDETKVESYINKIEPLVYSKPKDAYIDDYGDIIPEIHGHELNKEKFRTLLVDHFHHNNTTSFEIPVRALYPRIDSELLSHVRSKRIGLYTTYFNNNNHQRTHNIQLATRAINNVVLFPGEVFSFNRIVGKRTEQKGYLKAPVIIKGEISEGIGGGICQVSSTLFNAVDQIHVKIIERYSHSKQVPYVPPNRDATVSWYGPDFVFKNPHHQPLLIRAKTSYGKLIIEIYSSEDFS